MNLLNKKTSQSARSGNFILIIAGSIFFALMSTGAFFAHERYSIDNHLFKDGIRTQAKVVFTRTDIEPKFQNRSSDRVPEMGKSYMAEYEYIGKDGTPHRGEGPCGKTEFKAGDPLEIVYDPEEPSNSAPLRHVTPSLGNTIFWCTAGIFIFILMCPGLFLIYSGMYGLLKTPDPKDKQ